MSKRKRENDEGNKYSLYSHFYPRLNFNHFLNVMSPRQSRPFPLTAPCISAPPNRHPTFCPTSGQAAQRRVKKKKKLSSAEHHYLIRKSLVLGHSAETPLSNPALFPDNKSRFYTPRILNSNPFVASNTLSPFNSEFIPPAHLHNAQVKARKGLQPHAGLQEDS